MVELTIYVDGHFYRKVTMPGIPDRNDRLVFKDNPYLGYMVYSREFHENEIIIKTKLDK